MRIKSKEHTLKRSTAIVFGLLVLALGVIGLLAGSKQLLGFINVDLALDIGRLGLAAWLLYGAWSNNSTLIQSGLMIVAALYLGLGATGLVDREAFGLLPSGLTPFDMAFHLAAGLAALAIAMQGKSRRRA